MERRDLSSEENVISKESEKIGVSLETPETVGKLQKTLSARARSEPGFRFYSLYDKIYRWDVLVHAYDRCKENDGAAGVDGLTFEMIEKSGRSEWLLGLKGELRKKTYRPQPIRRVFIPKSNGKLRPLGIGTLRDRVAQMAVMIILEPIFEADLPDEQYGYRANRNAIDATQRIHSLLNTGHTDVIDADLKSYFDEIPHFELLKSLSRRIADGQLLKLIKSWLEVPTEETTAKRKKILRNQAKKERKGTPQGSPLSPLLSNVYMRRFILAWKKFGCEQRFRSKIVSYADDFVICCKRGKGVLAMGVMRSIMETIKLKVNEEKTRLCQFGKEKFYFLGYTFGYCYSPKSGKCFIGTRPSQKKISEACAKISEVTATNTTNLTIERTVERMNYILVGWFNYFKWGMSDPAFRVLDNHSRQRIRQWLRRKRVPRTKDEVERPITYYFDVLGIVRLEARPRNFVRVRARNFCP